MSAALTFENVGARYGGRAALRDVTAKFTAGAVTGIVGPNGAGKTTLLRAALGLLPLAGGTVHDAGSRSEAVVARGTWRAPSPICRRVAKRTGRFPRAISLRSGGCRIAGCSRRRPPSMRPP